MNQPSELHAAPSSPFTHPGRPRLIGVGALVATVLLLFGFEWIGSGTPGTGASLGRTSEILRDVSRLLGVGLSATVALCAIAIPLTANVYTPKLIDLFVADRGTRIVLSYFVLANVFVLWNKFVIESPGFSGDPRTRVLLCLLSGAAGALIIIPYTYYVLRFLVPANIVFRLGQRVVDGMERARGGSDPEVIQEACAGAVQHVQFLGDIALRSVDRYDRETVDHVLRTFRSLFDHYIRVKPHLPDEWFRVDSGRMHGMGPEVAAAVERHRAVIEAALLGDLLRILPLAMERLPETVAVVASLSRHFAVESARQGDAGAREMTILYFNTFLRVALQARRNQAFYRFVYQYRLVAQALLELQPERAARVAFYLDYYGHQAARMGIPYLLNVVAYDLAEIVDQAYRMKVPNRAEILNLFISLDRDETSLAELGGVVKAHIILAAKMRAAGEKEVDRRLVRELAKIRRETVETAFQEVQEAREETFWEVADRRRHLDHVDASLRPAIDDLRVEVRALAESGAGIAGP